MTASEILLHLVDHGIPDLTEDIYSESTHPVAGGGFSDIYAGRLERGHGLRVAIKIRRSNPDLSGYHCQMAGIIYKWSKCQHRNVIGLLGLTLFHGRIGLVLPWADRGTVKDLVYGGPGRMPSLVTQISLCAQISEGAAYLHGVGIVHGDIKAGNVLVSEDNTAMLADFDEAEIGDHSLVFTGKTIGNVLSLRWAAPELLTGTGPLEKTPYSDVYALGMTIIEVLFGRPPYFEIENIAGVAMLISQGKHPTESRYFTEFYGGDLLKLLASCWEYTPEARPSAEYVAVILRKFLSVTPSDLSLWPTAEGDSSSSEHSVIAIQRNMPLEEVVSYLTAHGCQDLSRRLGEQTFGVMPSLYGGSGDVYHGELLDSTVVCVKVPRFTENFSQQVKSRVYTSREIHTWNKCHHPNVLPFLGLAVFRNQLGLVSPWVKNGNLRQFLQNNPNADRCQLSTQICDGVTYLHSINIIHGDLKGENVLISDESTALLADFGSAEMLNRTITFTLLMNRAGWTTRWGAPELLQESTACSKEADIYALGMTILEALTGEPPFANKPDVIVVLAVCVNREIPQRPAAQIPINSRHGNKLWKLLCRCWSRETHQRPAAGEVATIMKTITKDGLIPGGPGADGDSDMIMDDMRTEAEPGSKPDPETWNMPVIEDDPSFPPPPLCCPTQRAKFRRIFPVPRQLLHEVASVEETDRSDICCMVV